MNLIAMLMLAADPGSQPLPDVVLLDFTAGYCQPCQQMVPILQDMEQDNYPVKKIDIGDHPDTARKYNVDRIPTLIVLVEGREVKRFVGLTADAKLRTAMNDAARELSRERRAARTNAAQSFSEFAEQKSPPKKETKPPSGLGGVFARIRQGLTGSSDDDAAAETAEIRGQSPESPGAAASTPPFRRATVRVNLQDGTMGDVGTGTIIHSAEGQSTILTCAHIFKNVSADARVEVEVFGLTKILKYPAKVLGGDHDADIALLRIQHTAAHPVAPFAPASQKLQSGQAVFSMGCNEGASPTQLSTRILKVDFFDGPANIVCEKDPAQGRSGGGLFNDKGQLVGVCSGAFRESKEGLYTGLKAVHKLIAQLEETSLFQDTTAERFAVAAPGQSDSGDIFATAPAQESAASPFESDDDLFDQMFDDNSPTVAADDPSGFGFNDPPFDTDSLGSFEGNARTVLASSATHKAGRTNSNSAEITVIIDGKGSAGKRVIVIPKASPWLLELLTGEPAAPEAVAARRTARASLTSTRPSHARSKVSAPTPRPRGDVPSPVTAGRLLPAAR